MNRPAAHFVVGLAPDGGRLSSRARKDLKHAIALGLNVDFGLHDYLLQDSELSKLAVRYESKSGIYVNLHPPRGFIFSAVISKRLRH
jgi:uncharacterized NAD-dependent epimerase/dehydratase family protein